MAGVTQEILVHSLPAIAGGAGAFAGAIADRYIQNTVHDGRANSFSQVLSGVAEQDHTASFQQKKGILSRFGTVALAGLAAGVVAGQAWSFDIQDREGRVPQIIVDKSGATSVKNDGEPAKIIDAVVQSLGKKLGDEQSTTIALRAGESEITTTKDISRIQTQGSANIASGVRLAMKEDSTLKGAQPVVVVSYDNAKLPNVNENDAQISVIKVGESSADMRKAAENTKGVYVEARGDTIEKAASDVVAAINPDDDQSNIKFENSLVERLIYTGFAGGIAIAGIGLARRTRIVRQGEDVVMTVGGRK